MIAAAIFAGALGVTAVALLDAAASLPQIVAILSHVQDRDA